MTTHADKTPRVLVIGRSPSVLIETVDRLRAKGYRANATNQFDRVLGDYDVADLDLLVFGGMVPPDTKQHLREEIDRRNPAIRYLQGLAGIPGVIVAQVEAATSPAAQTDQIEYDADRRRIRLRIIEPADTQVDAHWGTFTPPEPTSTSLELLADRLTPGTYDIAIPATVPTVASFVTVAVGERHRVLTIGDVPQSVRRMAPRSADDSRLPDVAAVATHDEE